jgi:hypothetical protein
MRAGLALGLQRRWSPRPHSQPTKNGRTDRTRNFSADCNGPMHRVGHPNSSALVAVPAMWSRPSLAASTRLEGAQ